MEREGERDRESMDPILPPDCTRWDSDLALP